MEALWYAPPFPSRDEFNRLFRRINPYERGFNRNDYEISKKNYEKLIKDLENKRKEYKKEEAKMPRDNYFDFDSLFEGFSDIFEDTFGPNSPYRKALDKYDERVKKYDERVKKYDERVKEYDKVQVKHTDEGLILRFYVPGYNKTNLSGKLVDGKLFKVIDKVEKKVLYVYELPKDRKYDFDKTVVHVKDGILTVSFYVVPKKPETPRERVFPFD